MPSRLEAPAGAALPLDLVGSRRGPGTAAKLRDLALVAVAFMTATAFIGAYAAYRIWEVGQRDDRRPADAIVVLGAAQYNGKPSAVLAARLDHAVELYKQGLAPYFVVTGGKLAGDRTTEAATERAYAISRGVPATAILSENQGRTTLESMQGVRQIFETRGLRTALFVSDRTHMLRLLRMAADQGIEAYGSPTTTSPSDSDPALRADAIGHELGGLALYLLVEQRAPASPYAASPAARAAPTEAFSISGTTVRTTMAATAVRTTAKVRSAAAVLRSGNDWRRERASRRADPSQEAVRPATPAYADFCESAFSDLLGGGNGTGRGVR